MTEREKEKEKLNKLYGRMKKCENAGSDNHNNCVNYAMYGDNMCQHHKITTIIKRELKRLSDVQSISILTYAQRAVIVESIAKIRGLIDELPIPNFGD